jgi:hypothetical protein
MKSTSSHVKTSYHVFTHGSDEWFDDYSEALTLFEQWAKEVGSARLYEETFIDNGLNSEDCLISVGEFPW